MLCCCCCSRVWLLQVQKRALMCVQKLMLPKDKLDFLQQAN
jgi:hypothetical protein